MTAVSRRLALAGSLSAIPLLTQAPAAASTIEGRAIGEKLAELERRHAGRICVGILDLASGNRVLHRADEPILLCSTFKVLAAANVLHRVDQGLEQIDRRVSFTKGDLVEYSPVTSGRTGEGGMSLSEICDAALGYSDNTAGNLLLATFGGPAGLTAFCRQIGDDATRLDRTEPDLNYPEVPNDRRDTTTASAMTENLRKLFFTDVLSDRSRAQLASWMVGTKTGDTRLRAGLPKHWLTADKTGTNNDTLGNANDIAVVWPSDRPPLIIAAYCEIPGISAAQRNSVVAEIGRIAAGG